MIKISKIRFKNFKTFKKNTIPFSRGFTTIAGANGSGKSNIIDGLLFAMGVTALKQVRATKLVDLINSEANENYALVELTINDSGKEILVNREIDKQGKSVYRLNGKRCTLNEISNLLLELGVRVDGHNIVVQGDVTRVIEMSPLQRRLIIDEVAGLKEFDEKKLESEKNLGKVEVRIKEAIIVLNEREKRLTELEEEMKMALRYQDCSKQLKQAKATQLFEELDKMKTSFESFNSQSENLILERNNDEKFLNDFKRKIDSSEKRIEELNNILIQAGEKTYEGLGKEIEGVRSNIRVLEERFHLKDSEIARKKNRIQSLGEEQKIAGEQNKDKKVQLENDLKQLKVVEIEVNELKKKLHFLESKNEKALLESKKLYLRIEEYREKLNSSQENYFNLKSDLDKLIQKINYNENLKVSIISELQELDKSITEKNSFVSRKKEIEKKFGDTEKNLTKVTNEITKIVEKISYLKNKKEISIDSVQKLKGSKAICPICDSDLPNSKKKGLIIKKEKEEKDSGIRIEKLLVEKASKESKLSELNEAINEIRKINVHISNLNELNVKRKEFEIKLKELEKIDKEDISKREKIDKEINTKHVELEKQKSKIAELEDNYTINNNLDQKVRELRKKMDIAKESKEKLVQLISDCKLGMQDFLGLTEQGKDEKSRLEKEVIILSDEKKEDEKELVKERASLKDLEIQLKKMVKENRDLLAEKEKLLKYVNNSKSDVQKLQQEITTKDQRINEFAIEKSKLEVRITDVDSEYKEFSEVQLLENRNLEVLRKMIEDLEKEIAKIGEVNFKAIRNYDEFRLEVEEVRKKAEKLDKERLAVVDLISKIVQRRSAAFMECFDSINNHFNLMYKSLADGEGKLGLTNFEDPLDAGLIVEARHAGEKLKNIDSMSGGEKSLTALAFMFSIQQYEPAPFYIFDEADAALDKSNSIKLAKMVKEISRSSQFIAVTHNDALIEQSDQIIGVTKGSENSSVIGLKVKDSMPTREKNKSEEVN